MERKNTVFLTIIAVATLLIAVIGATFAYFSVIITGNESATSTIIRTANIKITYTAGTNINLTSASPGDTANLTFSVANEGDRELSYKVKWTDVANTFGSLVGEVSGVAEELYYTVNVVDNNSNSVYTLSRTTAPSTNGYINLNSGNAITIAGGVTHNYTLTMTFEETSSAQNYNQGRTFTGAVDIELAGNNYYSTDDVYSGE
ncbi:MAG: hypothetical protein J5892_03660 [Bacilli bacterium]|nr:hypothetical protein [Bacilli bacterium]